MKNIALGILCILGFSLGKAQDVKIEEYIAKVTYDKITWSEKSEGNVEVYLYADDVKSQLIHDVKGGRFTTEEGYFVTISYLYYINNYDFLSKKVEENRTLTDKTILYAQWQNNMEWEITDEEKMIGEYKVRKAVTKSIEMSEDDEWYQGNAIAWFATDIPIPSGPARYYGLPGLILELEYEKGRTRYKFKNLEFIPKESYEFVELNKENPVREKEDVIYFFHKNPKEIKEIQKRNKKSK